MAKKKALSNIEKIAKRYKITAREARDIATAVGTVVARGATPPKYKDPGTPGKNLIKQIKEVGTAATKGKRGTTSDRFGRQIPGKVPGYVDVSYGYEKGKQRKAKKKK